MHPFPGGLWLIGPEEAAAPLRIATVDQPLARHLRAGIHTGLNCSYEPDPADSLDWVLD